VAGHSSTIQAQPSPCTASPDDRAPERPSGDPPAAGQGPAALLPGSSPEFACTLGAGRGAVTPSSLVGKQLATDAYFQGTFGGGAVVRRFIKRLALPQSWPLPGGQVIFLQLPPDGRPVRLLVDFCGQLGGRWVLFCTFLDIRPADVLRYFGPDGPTA
jgi:hypothetical protein